MLFALTTGDPSFELCVSPLRCCDLYPIIVGIALPSVDLTRANFFTSDGVFLCLGGSAAGVRLGALGAPGGPFVQGFGRRKRPELPKGHEGCRLQLNYTEALARQYARHIAHMYMVYCSYRNLFSTDFRRRTPYASSKRVSASFKRPF